MEFKKPHLSEKFTNQETTEQNFLSRLKELFGDELFTLKDLKGKKLVPKGGQTILDMISDLCEKGDLKTITKSSTRYYQIIKK